MTTRILLVLTFVMAVAATLLTGTGSARADISCSGTVGGGASVTNVSGNVNVPAGASLGPQLRECEAAASRWQAAPACLSMAYTEPSTIGGSITAAGCASTYLEGNVTVGGDLLISGCSSGPNGFQGPDILIQGNFS